ASTDSDCSPIVVGLAAGLFHTCALLNSGSVKCWGANDEGQLGSNTGESHVPVDVVVLPPGFSAVAIAAWEATTCAVSSSGSLKCWGTNYWGQALSQTSNVSAVAPGGEHTCFLTTTGGARCAGYNLYGQLGNNSTTTTPVPVDVVGLASGV